MRIQSRAGRGFAGGQVNHLVNHTQIRITIWFAFRRPKKIVYDLSSSTNQPSELGLLSSIREPIPKDQLPTTDMKDSIATGDDSDSDYSQVSDCGARPPDREILH